MTSSSRSNSSSSSMTNPLATSSTKGGSRRRLNVSRSRARSASLALAGGKRRSKRGGSCGAGSAWQNGVDVVGPGPTAYNRVFDNGAGPTPYGNAVVGTSGQNSVIPPSVASSGVIKGGKRRTKRGGYWGQVLSNALVPFGLWAAQNRYSKRRGVKHGGAKHSSKTRKHRKH